MAGMGVKEVIAEGYCIGCGACTVSSGAATIKFNHYGELEADIQGCNEAEIVWMDRVCPFSSFAPNETDLAKVAFKNELNANSSHEIGIYTGLYAGYSNAYRKWGSSGGVVTWLLSKLLTVGMVDKVIVVGRSMEGERFFDFRIVDNPQDLISTGTSFYYPVSYDGVLKYVIDNPGRYAITGVPCFHKALRQLKVVTPVLAERIVYQIGIVCGQMKSSFYLEYLSRKAGGVALPVNASFRRKDEASRADDYLFEASYKGDNGVVETRTIRNSEIGANWGMGLFKPKACDFCDDVYAETADISVMDAWLNRYVSDGRGTSLVVTRTGVLQDILVSGKASGELQLETVSEDDMVESQRGGLNHRRAGLRYRLHVAGDQVPVPVKRLQPNNDVDVWFGLEQRIRSATRKKSRFAMRKQLDSGCVGLSIYESEMRGVLRIYKWFGRLKNRIAGRRDYRRLFKLDR